MVVLVDIVMLFQFPVENNSCSSCISYELGSIWYIIQIIYCDNPIDDLYSNPPYFNVFVIWYLSMP